jgi:hypothetical protein
MPVIVFQGNCRSLSQSVNADQVLTQWARTNDYLDGNVDGKSVLDHAGELTNGSIPGGYSFQKCKYEDSAGRLLMEKWLIQDLGRAWSGSPSAGRFADQKGPNASEEMWRFFCDTTLDSRDQPASGPALRGALASLFSPGSSVSQAICPALSGSLHRVDSIAHNLVGQIGWALQLQLRPDHIVLRIREHLEAVPHTHRAHLAVLEQHVGDHHL